MKHSLCILLLLYTLTLVMVNGKVSTKRHVVRGRKEPVKNPNLIHHRTKQTGRAFDTDLQSWRPLRSNNSKVAAAAASRRPFPCLQAQWRQGSASLRWTRSYPSLRLSPHISRSIGCQDYCLPIQYCWSILNIKSRNEDWYYSETRLVHSPTSFGATCSALAFHVLVCTLSLWCSKYPSKGFD